MLALLGQHKAILHRRKAIRHKAILHRCNGNNNVSGNPNSNNSNGNGSNQGGSSVNNGPQGPDPSGGGLHKLVFAYQTMGGPLQNWGIEGAIQVTEVVRFTPDTNSPVPNQLALNSVRRLAQPDIVDWVTDHVHFNNQHNDRTRVQAIINGMDVFALTALNAPIISDNLTMLEDDERSSEELCNILVGHLLYAETLPPNRLPWEVPIVLYAGQMQTHPYAITGSFGHVKKVDDTNTIASPYGRDHSGALITNPVVTQLPVLPPIPAAPPRGAPPVAGPVVGNGPDPKAFIQGVLTAIQAMTQMNFESNSRNASMTQQQSALQAASIRANQLQFQHLTNHLGNLGHEVGRAIASHPTCHNHTIQATLSQPNVAPGQSNNPQVLGSLTCTTPPSMSIPSFNYSPYIQVFQPQPNNKHTRRIDEATHQIVQRYLPTSVKTRYDAAHSSGIVLPVSYFINGFKFVVETSVGHGHEVFCGYYWHSSFGTGCITASGFMLQPNIQE